jgi:hypothetical protein
MNYYKGDKVEIYWVLVEQRVKDISVGVYHHTGLSFTIDKIDESGNLIYKYGKGDEEFLVVFPKQVKLIKRSLKNWWRYFQDVFREKLGNYYG